MTIVERTQSTVRTEESQLDRLFDTHVNAVYAYVLRRTNAAATAEDIASEVFSDAFQRPDRIPFNDPLPWLLGIARRKIADHFRRMKVRREVALSDHVLSSKVSAVGLLLQDEQARQLRLWVNRLPEEQREALLLHYVEGLTAQQISVILCRSTFAVNSLLQRARRRVMEQGQHYFANETRRP